jgi:hypothetical protein
MRRTFRLTGQNAPGPTQTGGLHLVPLHQPGSHSRYPARQPAALQFSVHSAVASRARASTGARRIIMRMVDGWSYWRICEASLARRILYRNVHRLRLWPLGQRWRATHKPNRTCNKFRRSCDGGDIADSLSPPYCSAQFVLTSSGGNSHRLHVPRQSHKEQVR